jgi:hypothetical protein
MLDGLIRRISARRSPVSIAASKFRSQRFDYYRNLADLLEVTANGGRGASVLKIFERDAERFAGEVRGILAAHWATRYMESGARFDAAWEGTLPDNEVAWIGVAEDHGSSSVVSALRDLARVGENIAQCKREFISTVGIAAIATGLTFVMILAMPFFFKPFILNAFSGVREEFYGPLTQRYLATCDVISAGWMPMLAVIGGLAYWLKWALPNWTGPLRAKFDEKSVLFTLYRDFKGSEFLATFASLTKSTGSAVTNQRDALKMMQKRAVPWLDWKIRMMLERIDAEGANDASALDVGIVDRETFYLIYDVQEARGISDGLTVAGLKSEARAAETISKRSKWIRWSLLIMCVATMGSVMFWQQGVMYEFKKSITSQFSQ